MMEWSEPGTARDAYTETTKIKGEGENHIYFSIYSALTMAGVLSLIIQFS